MRRIECTNCGHRLKYGDEHAGKKAKCQKCRPRSAFLTDKNRARAVGQG